MFNKMKVQSRFIAFVGCFGALWAAEEQLGKVSLSGPGRVGTRSLGREGEGAGQVKRGGWMLWQQKPEPKAGDRSCFLNLLVVKGLIAIVVLLNILDNRVNGDSGSARHERFLLFFGKPDGFGRARGWWRWLWKRGCVPLSLLCQPPLR